MAAKTTATATTSYCYEAADGTPAFAVVRFDGDNGKTYRQLVHDGRGWTWKAPTAPRPLYRLTDLADAETVFVVEGEKVADAIRAIGLVATTSSQGAGSAGKTDWSPLAGKRVILCPDADTEGEKYVAAVRERLAQLDLPAQVAVVPLADVWRGDAPVAEGDDLADWLDRGVPDPWAEAECRTALLAAAERAEASNLHYRNVPAAAPPEPAAPPAVSFGLLDSAALDAATFPREWLVRGLLVRGQPCLMGGPRKSLKTSLLVALTLAMATGRSFLGHFAVPARRRVLFLSGESGDATIQETARRVARSMGLDLADVGEFAYWGFRLPKLSQADHLLALAEAIRERAVDVVIVDPLYLCLLSPGLDVSAANLFEVGPLLMEVARTCLDAGATPILAHHFRKSVADPHALPELDDLAFAGFAEFARQHLLLARRAPYVPGSGRHELWLNAGGSAGHGGAWAVDVEEGVIDDDFAGRFWSVRVAPAVEVKRDDAAEKALARQQQRDEAKRARVDTDATALVAFLKRSGPTTARKLRAGLHWGAARAEQAAARAVAAGWARETTITIAAGSTEREETALEAVPDAS